MEKTKQSNSARPSLAKTGLGISLIGCVCLMLFASYLWLEREAKIELGQAGLEGNILPPGIGSLFRGLLAAIFALCVLVCGSALSFLGVILSLLSLIGAEKHVSGAGIVFGVAGPLILLIVSNILA